MVLSGRNTLKKSERLNHKKDIELLFTSGAKSILAYPIRAVYMAFPKEEAEHDDKCNAILLSVSKRYFKHSVDRNHVKRQLREAYRTNKYILKDIPDSVGHVYIAFLWTDGRLHPSDEINAKMKNLLNRIVEAFNK